MLACKTASKVAVARRVTVEQSNSLKGGYQNLYVLGGENLRFYIRAIDQSSITLVLRTMILFRDHTCRSGDHGSSPSSLIPRLTSSGVNIQGFKAPNNYRAGAFSLVYCPGHNLCRLWNVILLMVFCGLHENTQ